MTSCMPPLLVYLDQWTWQDLVRGRPGGSDAGLERARESCYRAKTEGRALFPLSSVHYHETWAHNGVLERGDRAAEMAGLSGFLTLRDWDAVRREEMSRAIQWTFDRPLDPRPAVLGQGVAHALGAEMPEDLRDLPLAEAVEVEFAFLWSPIEEEHDRFKADRRDGQEAFALAEASRRAAWHELRGAAGYMRRFRISAGFGDFEREWIGMLIGNDIAVEEFAAIGDDGIEAMIQRTPSVFAFTELRRIRYGDPKHPIKRSDLNDLRALALALPYCDVVTADKAWVDAIRAAKLEDWFGKTVVRSAHDLAALLDERRSEIHPVSTP